MQKIKNPFGGEISEDIEDDPEFEMNVQLNDEVYKSLREKPLSSSSSSVKEDE